MSYTLQGTLYKKFPTVQKTPTFESREFVVEVQDDKYPQLIKFQLAQAMCGLLDHHQVGEDVNVTFDVRGREWNDKYFTNLQAFKIEAMGTPKNKEEVNEFPTTEDFGEVKEDDMPF